MIPIVIIIFLFSQIDLKKITNICIYIYVHILNSTKIKEGTRWGFFINVTTAAFHETFI